MGNRIRHLTRGVQLSFAIHILVLGIMILAGGSSIRKSRPLIIDFTVEPSANIATPGAERKPEAKLPGPARLPHARKAKNAPAPHETELEPAKPVTDVRASAGPQAAPARSPSDGPAFTLPGQNGGRSGADRGVTAATGRAERAGKAVEDAKTEYIARNFEYIRRIIMKNLAYPGMARRMGWTGKVIVSFVVCEDGNVEDIGIVKSSGFDLLDRGAVETIKKSCPLPRPPVRAQLKVPIVYRLE